MQYTEESPDDLQINHQIRVEAHLVAWSNGFAKNYTWTTRCAKPISYNILGDAANGDAANLLI